MLRPSSLALALPVVLALAATLGACPPPADGDGDGAGEGEGEGDAAEGEGEGEGEGDAGEGEGEGEGDAGEGEGEGEGEGDACGADVVDGAFIDNTEGLVVGADGTVYYSQPFAIGRRSVGGVVVDNFAALPGASTVWGVMLSPDNARLYAASPVTASVFVVDAATGAVDFEIDTFVGPNGLTVDADGQLFVSDFFDDRVVRLTVGPTLGDVDELEVAGANLVSAPNGVIVDGDDLLVLQYGAGTLLRLAGGRVGVASGADVVADGLGNPDGIVRAADGSYFVTDNGGGELLHVALEDGVAVTGTFVSGGIPAAANAEFGGGALRCDRLLVTSSGTLEVLDVGVAGAPVPWR